MLYLFHMQGNAFPLSDVSAGTCINGIFDRKFLDLVFEDTCQ